MSTDWYKHAHPIDDETKELQSEIVTSIEQELNFDTTNNKWHRGDTF